MPITRYWGDPFTSQLGYGFTSAFDDWRRRNEIEHYKGVQEEAENKKEVGVGVGAVLGAIGGFALAPAAAAGAAAGATAVPAATAFGGGAAAAGGAGLGGALAAGLPSALLGAGVGAGLGEAFTSGNTGPLYSSLGDAASYATRGRERAEDRAFSIADRRRDTDERVRQAKELSTIPEFGLPYSEALDAERTNYLGELGMGPDFGSMLDLPSPAGPDVPAYGPMGGKIGFGPNAMGPPGPVDRPGPSTIPGMEKVWGPSQYRALARLERERQDTIDNPSWVASNGPEARELQRQALAKRFAEIRTTTRPSQPKFMIPGPDGQMIPGQPGWNDIGDYGGVILGVDGSFEQYVPPTKRRDADTTYPVTLPDGSVYEQQLGSSYPIPEWGLIRTVSENGKVDYTEIPGAGGVDYSKMASGFIKPDTFGVLPEGASQSAVQEYRTEKETRWLLKMEDVNVDAMTISGYERLGDEITREYGNPERVPQSVKEKYYELGAKFR